MASLLSSNRKRVVSLSGHLNAATAPAVQADLEQALRSAEPLTLALDMSSVDSVDSAGLMLLLDTLKLARSSNAELVLCAIPASVHIILELTQLNQVFHITDELPLETVNTLAERPSSLPVAA